MPPSATCYLSENNVSGLAANAISIDDGGEYGIFGKAIALGAGGLTASTAASATGFALLALALELSAPQSWSVDGNNNHSGLALEANVSGASAALGIGLSHRAIAEVGPKSDIEVGAVTIKGGNLSASPFENGAVALTHGSINATDANPVTVDDAGLFGIGTVGALTSASGSVQAGPQGALSVAGAASFDAGSRLIFFIDHPGSVVGTDYTQLSAIGSVSLGGAHLALFSSEEACPTLNLGEVDTLIATTGSISGTFAGLPNGATVKLGCIGARPTLLIEYGAGTVTVTVAPEDIPTSTTLSANPGEPVTNQAVTLTATVSASSGAPSGSVSFRDHGVPIGGCESQPLSFSGVAYTATCQTAFAAVSPPILTAAFTPAAGSNLQSSSSASVTLRVGRDSTTTALRVSNATPAVGTTVTVTATVTPAHAGSAQPSGSVSFFDENGPIAACTGRPLSTGPSPSATCTLSYASASAHGVAAAYLGDANFRASSSPGQTVNVQAPVSSNGSATSNSGSASMTSGIGETGARSGGVLGSVTASVSSGQIRTALLAALVRSGKSKIASLLRRGGVGFPFSAPAAGVAEIDWYQLPPGAKLASKAKPVLVAAGKLAFPAAGSTTMKIRLTAAGKSLLRHAKKVGLTAKGTFTPPEAAPVTVRRKFALRR